MPLTVTVGLNRKASHHDQSHGVSINLTAELDGTLLSNADELQQRIARLYQHAEAAVASQMSRSGVSEPRDAGKAASHASWLLPMTEAQRRTILAIACECQVNAYQQSQMLLGKMLNALSRVEASHLIDALKQRGRHGNHNAAFASGHGRLSGEPVEH